jgi:hypothetical protein
MVWALGALCVLEVLLVGGVSGLGGSQWTSRLRWATAIFAQVFPNPFVRRESGLRTYKSTSIPHVISQHGRKRDGRTFVWMIWPGINPIA